MTADVEGAVTGFARLVLLTMVPFVLAGQGTMLAGRAGLFNVSQEGVMLAAASAGFLVGYGTGSLVLGALAAMALGGLFGLLLAWLTTTLRMNQFVTGMALLFVGIALSTLLPKLVIGVTLTPPMIPTLPELPVPGLSRLPVVGAALFSQNVLVYVCIALSGLLHYLLYRTSAGLSLRAIGENPAAADAAGIDVAPARYGGAVVGGMLVGLAGAYLPMAYTGTFTEGIVKGRGWLVIALTFFGRWSPLPILLGALFFAGVEVLAYRVQVGGSAVPYQFVLLLPYVATLAVMTTPLGRSGTPAALGTNHDRESRS